jgi:DNA topoisomerase-1
MAKKLIIVESPGKIKTIKSFLSSEYVVMASIGHVRILDKTGKYNLGVDLENNFTPTYANDPDKKEVIKNLKAAVKGADHVYLAMDNDLEGEAIAWHLQEVLKVSDSKLSRIVFNEITKKAVEEGIKNARSIDEKKVEAQETRRIIDRIVGFRLSSLTFSKLKAKSAGRVQSSALKILAERENEIKAFVPKEYFELYLDFEKNKGAYTAKYRGTDKKVKATFDTKAEVDKIITECKTGQYEVKEINAKDIEVQPKPPYTTSTFQQEVSAKLNYGSKKAMQIAQSLYEGISIDGKHQGLITYMRTDSTRLSDDFIAEAKTTIEKQYGKNYYSGTVAAPKKSKTENVQDAHEGIHPTHLELTPEKVAGFLDPQELKVYTLIYNRSLAALMKPAKLKETEVIISNNKHNFRIAGKEIIFDGYMKAYDEFTEDTTDEDKKILPSFKVGEKINDKKLRSERKETTPPGRYTESSLVKQMEKLGIGRPSTYAGTIETLKSRDYIEMSNKSIVVTEIGLKVSKMLDEFFADFINTTYTADMEQKLDEIAEGKAEKLKQLKDFYELFAPLVTKAGKDFKSERGEAVPAGKKCPKCGSDMVIRKGKFGDFAACSKYPKCKHTEKIGGGEEQPKAPVVKTGHKCPVCKKGELVERVAKKSGSKFYACNAFPKCKTTFSEDQFNIQFPPKE